MKNAWVLFCAVTTLIILAPFVAIGFACGFCWWGLRAGVEGAEECVPEHIRKLRKELKGHRNGQDRAGL
jgi:hypothetical protein